MAKQRRTKRQKIKAKHQFTISWGETHKYPKKGNIVKGQSKFKQGRHISRMKHAEKAENEAENTSLASIRQNLVRSLRVASLILSLEVMLYLATR